MRELLRGVGDLGRGFRVWGSSPRLMLLGAVPALIVGAVWLGALVALLTSLDGVAAWLTGFADTWAQPFRGALRLAAGFAVLVLAIVVGGLGFTAVVLTVGDPFYERISRAVEERLGDAPADREEPMLRGLARAARDGLLLLLASVLVGVVSFLLGLLPVVGVVVGFGFGAVVGGWFLAVELTGTPFDARGFRMRERRRALARIRGRTLGFGIACWILFLLPLGAVVTMPAAVAGATALSRHALPGPGAGRRLLTRWSDEVGCWTGGVHAPVIPRSQVPLVLLRSSASRRLVLTAVLVAVVTAALRLAVDLRSGGLAGAGSVDDGVHYTAAASLLAGRPPYRDILFLHPPGIVLALVPFAALGRVIGDAHAFELARLGGILLGAVNAGLVVLVLRRFRGPGPVVGALVYACSWPVVFAERSALLEPVGCFLLLTACALVVEPTGRRRTVLAGMALGAMVVVKLTFVPPAVVVLLAMRGRALLAGAVGAAVAAVVALPFLVAAPAAMWQDVVLDQLGRPRLVPMPSVRLAGVLLPPVLPGVPRGAAFAAVLAVAAVLVAVGLLTPTARRYAVLVLVELPLLLASPSFYAHYGILAVLPLALLSGVAVGRLGSWAAARHGGAARLLPLAAIAALLVTTLGPWTPARVAALSTPALPAGLVRALRSTGGCAIADDSTTLVLAGLVTRDLDRGCALQADVEGSQYERTGRWPTPPALENAAYQRRMLAYLRSGDVVVITRRSSTLTAPIRAEVLHGRVLWSGRTGTVVATRSAAD